MPSTFWSAPVPVLNTASQATAVAAALTDYSPAEVIVPGGLFILGTRIRLRATGSMVTSAATATPTWGFYMTNVTGTQVLNASSLPIAVTGAVTVPNTGSASWPWSMEWDGYVKTVSTSAAASATYFGQGKFWQTTSITAWALPVALPITLALRTVTQVAGGGNTALAQQIHVAATPNVTTALTTITCDELTCELLG